MRPDFRYGFRALGRDDDRRLVVWKTAYTAHVEADLRAATDGECYLSAFTFGDAFRHHLESTGSPKGYSGPTGAEFVFWDIDRADNLEAALTDARRLAAGLELSLGLDGDELMVFFSGSKGFHIGAPAWLMNAEPLQDFSNITRCFCCLAAESVGVEIDRGVYSRVNLFRAPNTRHRKTGLYKIPLTPGELSGLSMAAIQRMATEPREGWIPREREPNPAAVELWQRAASEVAEVNSATAERKTREGKTRLNPSTRAILRGELPSEGDRHRLLFSAASDMAEFGSMESLIQAILTEPGQNCGLSASECSRQIECGVQHGGRHRG